MDMRLGIPTSARALNTYHIDKHGLKLGHIAALTRHPGIDDPLSRLPFAEDAPFNSFSKQHETDCLPDTRISLLEEIYSWTDGQNKRCIFWLYGLAGTGKSTIALWPAGTLSKAAWGLASSSQEAAETLAMPASSLQALPSSLRGTCRPSIRTFATPLQSAPSLSATSGTSSFWVR